MRTSRAFTMESKGAVVRTRVVQWKPAVMEREPKNESNRIEGNRGSTSSVSQCDLAELLEY